MCKETRRKVRKMSSTFYEILLCSMSGVGRRKIEKCYAKLSNWSSIALASYPEKSEYSLANQKTNTWLLPLLHKKVTSTGYVFAELLSIFNSSVNSLSIAVLPVIAMR